MVKTLIGSTKIQGLHEKALRGQGSNVISFPDMSRPDHEGSGAYKIPPGARAVRFQNKTYNFDIVVFNLKTL